MIYTVVDIETTGNGLKGNKITEIAIFKINEEQILEEFCSLVNPGIAIPSFITNLTGISNEMVYNAPTFEEIAATVEELTKDSIFVAHSVNFDYGVLNEEFKRLGLPFNRKKLCTVRLSRKLIPGLASYSLGKLASQLNIHITERHRARGDALATVSLFYQILQKPNAEKLISEFLKKQSRASTLPSWIDAKEIEKLPNKPGIYYFLDTKNTIIYVGKAKKIKSRVLSHFYDKTNHEIRLCRETASIDFKLSGSELVALLMESSEIKKHYPKYNRAQKEVLCNTPLLVITIERGF